MIKLLASDLDGTIFDNEHQIATNNQKAIELIKKSNINFVICTGKTYSICKDVCDTFHANYGIFGNGMQVMNLQTGEEIYKKTLPISHVLTCIHVAKQKQLHIHFYTNEEIITEKLAYMDLRNYYLFKSHLSFKVVKNIEEYIKNNQPEIMKLVISDNQDLAEVKGELEKLVPLHIRQVKKIGEYRDSVIHKEYCYLDIIPNHVGKYEALQFLTEKLQVKQEEVMSIGDNLNDLNMIQKSGIGIAVGDAYEEVKKIADYTTKATAREGAFAEAIYKFIKY